MGRRRVRHGPARRETRLKAHGTTYFGRPKTQRSRRTIAIDAVTVEVGGMWVRPDRRRCGIGRELLAEILAWARERGANRAGLWVRESNEPARLLYESDLFRPSESARNGLRLERALNAGTNSARATQPLTS